MTNLDAIQNAQYNSVNIDELLKLLISAIYELDDDGKSGPAIALVDSILRLNKDVLTYLEGAEFPNKQATTSPGTKVIIQDRGWVDQEQASEALFNAQQIIKGLDQQLDFTFDPSEQDLAELPKTGPRLMAQVSGVQALLKQVDSHLNSASQIALDS